MRECDVFDVCDVCDASDVCYVCDVCDVFDVFDISHVSCDSCKPNALTSIADVVDVIQVDLLGAKVVVPRSYGVAQLAVASVAAKDDRIVTVLLVLAKGFDELIFRIERLDTYIHQRMPRPQSARMHAAHMKGEKKLNYHYSRHSSICIRQAIKLSSRKVLKAYAFRISIRMI